MPRATKRIARRRRPRQTTSYHRKEWLVLVRAVRKRSRGICEACGAAPAVGQPHHRSYADFAGWRRLIVPLDQLVDCCRACHLEFHGNPEGLFA